MNAKKLTVAMLDVLSAPTFGQTIYKCPSATPGAPPIIQQMPCSPQGGGETRIAWPGCPDDEGAGLRVADAGLALDAAASGFGNQ